MYEDIATIPSPKTAQPFTVFLSGISYCDGSYQIQRPQSRYYCMEYIIQGRGTVLLDGDTFEPEAGDVYILPAGKDQYYYSDKDDPWIKIWFNAGGQFIENTLETYQLGQTYHIKNAPLHTLFREFFEITKFALPPDEIHRRCAVVFLEIVQALAQRIQTDMREADNSPLAVQLKNQLDILRNFSIPFSDLIAPLFCSESHAIRVFKQTYGITPYQYLLQKKLAFAKTMLEGTRLPVKEIASTLGFKDNHYFSSFFKKQTGVSPQQWRNSFIISD